CSSDLVMVLQRESSIREVMPFPKTQTGVDRVTSAPAPGGESQLAELGIQLRPEVAAARAEAENQALEGPLRVEARANNRSWTAVRGVTTTRPSRDAIVSPRIT